MLGAGLRSSTLRVSRRRLALAGEGDGCSDGVGNGERGKVLRLLNDEEKAVLANGDVGAYPPFAHVKAFLGIPGPSSHSSIVSTPNYALPFTPYIPLSSLTSSTHPPILQAIRSILSTERTDSIRSAIASHQRPSFSASLPDLDGRNLGLRGDVLAVSSFPGRGEMAVPLVVALYRWRLFTGEGWEAIEKS